jgi:hypothetical protein
MRRNVFVVSKTTNVINNVGFYNITRYYISHTLCITEFTTEQAMKAQRGSRDIALLFL